MVRQSACSCLEKVKIDSLFQFDVAVGVDSGFAMWHVCSGEVHYFVGYALFGVFAWTDAFLLEEGVNLTTEETALLVDADDNYWRIGGDACQTHAVRCAEIAKAVGNEAAFIDFGGTNDVGTVSVNNVSTIVNAEMGKLTQTATVLAQEALCTLWQVVLRTTLGTSVEGDDDDVGLLLQIVEDALNSL